MHFEILVEGQAELTALSILMSKILGGYGLPHTWEKLAEAIHPGGLVNLEMYGKRSVRILEQKRIWASNICPYLDVQTNQSPSFQAFRDGIRRIAAI